jgi:hypothetical protein
MRNQGLYHDAYNGYHGPQFEEGQEQKQETLELDGKGPGDH